MFINGLNYQSSYKCSQISQEHAIFDVTITYDYGIFCTINIIFNSELDSNEDVSLKARSNMSTEEYEKLISSNIEWCKTRAAFVFGKKSN